MTAAVPSIGRRLGRALVAWTAVWGLAVTTAVWLQADHEVDELLDDTLQASAQVLAPLLLSQPATSSALAALDGEGESHFAWQLVSRQGGVIARSPLAPGTPLHRTPTAGLSNVPGWRVFGRPLGPEGRMLYVAQTRGERLEAQGEVALSAVLAALAVGLLGHLWLRARIRHELSPLRRLSARLAALEPSDPDRVAVSLGAAERQELQPVHEAVEALARRLARRIAHERAFSAHAAHSLRTPLAAIDAQLAVALREAPAPLQPRLQRVRDAAGRLQRVVAALLALFRSGQELRPQRLDVQALLARVPLELQLQVEPGLQVTADPDLLTAALLNLLDNAQRVGARHVRVDAPTPQRLRLSDDGPGVDPARRDELRRALSQEDYEGHTGLGLMLADLVARAHGGRLSLPEVAQGFAVELQLAPGAGTG